MQRPHEERARAWGGLALVVATACSVGTGADSTFGAASVGPGSNPSSTEAGDGSGDDASGDDTGGSATSVGPPADTDQPPPPPGAEVCNGIDDDGDGQIDEDQPTVTCGVGSCEVTVASCEGGVM
ncbi:MAG: hypothetical protein K0V04_13280, partial [Deltaproteobacteria bacterium]|nr:hypothetical protein [Deltaproteobacteria bacterium]